MNKIFKNFNEFFEDLVQELKQDEKCISVAQYFKNEEASNGFEKLTIKTEIEYNVMPCVDLDYLRHLLVVLSNESKIPWKSFVVEETEFGKRLLTLERLA